MNTSVRLACQQRQTVESFAAQRLRSSLQVVLTNLAQLVMACPPDVVETPNDDLSANSDRMIAPRCDETDA